MHWMHDENARMRRLILGLCVCLLWMPWPPSYAAERVALVIGNTAYWADPVTGAAQDAGNLATSLEARGYFVLSGQDLNHVQMRKLVDKFLFEARRAETVLVYYAGHALQLGALYYMVPVDVSLSSRADLKKIARLDFARVLGAAARDKPLLALIDGCRVSVLAEGWGENMGRSPVCAAQALHEVSGGKRVAVVVPTTEPQSAADRPAGEDGFASALQRQLDQPDQDLAAAVAAANADFQRRSKLQPSVAGSLASLRGPSTVAARTTQPRSLPGAATPIATPTATPGADSGEQTSALLVQATPADARIRVLNIGPVYEPNMQLPVPQAYHIEVSKAGFQTWREWVDLGPEHPPLRVELQVAPVSASALSVTRQQVAGNRLTLEVRLNRVGSDAGVTLFISSRRADRYEKIAMRRKPGSRSLFGTSVALDTSATAVYYYLQTTAGSGLGSATLPLDFSVPPRSQRPRKNQLVLGDGCSRSSVFSRTSSTTFVTDRRMQDNATDVPAGTVAELSLNAAADYHFSTRWIKLKNRKYAMRGSIFAPDGLVVHRFTADFDNTSGQFTTWVTRTRWRPAYYDPAGYYTFVVCGDGKRQIVQKIKAVE